MGGTMTEIPQSFKPTELGPLPEDWGVENVKKAVKTAPLHNSYRAMRDKSAITQL